MSGLLKRRRKASWLAFGLAVLAICARGAETQQQEDTSLLTQDETSPAYDEAVEASRAYKQALQSLATLSALSPLTTPPSPYTSSAYSGRGPIDSTRRIIARLQRQWWLPKVFVNFLGKPSWRRWDDARRRAIKVLDLLEHAVDLGHIEALYTLARVSLFPPSPTMPMNLTRAFDAYSRHAALTGNATSHGMLGFFHSTGYAGVVEPDQAQALLHYTFGATGGDFGAQLALGYKYWTGIGVNDDCMKALTWYEAAAEQSMQHFSQGPPGGRSLPLTVTRLSDLEGGIFGHGASVASTGFNSHRAAIRAAKALAAGETWDDILEYYIFNADRGELDFAFRLGKIFYQGSIYSVGGGISGGGEGFAAVPRDYHRARVYFTRIARTVWPRDNVAKPLVHKREAIGSKDLAYAVASAGYLGRIFLRGEGVKADPAIAKMWFERGAEHGDKECHNGLGVIWRDGLIDNRIEIKKALAHFSSAAGQDLPEAQVQLGKHHYSKGEYKAAASYFEAAVRHGSAYEAYYYIAEIQSTQAQTITTPTALVPGSCAIAVSFYKLLSERGSWPADKSLREAEIRWRSGSDIDKQAALLRWAIAAERGYEPAQNNLAYVLDQDRSLLDRLRLSGSPSNDTARVALTQWTRSASQRNIDALVKVGDYYYSGLGVAAEDVGVRMQKAASYYQSAVETQLSALAMWNLGWMYENGVGVPQDFYLAKRHYDMALETNGEAYMPVTVSLYRLHLRSLWDALLGGKQSLTFLDEEHDDDTWYYGGVRDLFRRLLTGRGSARRAEEMGVPEAGEPVYEDKPARAEVDLEEDADWYPGKAREEHLRRQRTLGSSAQIPDDAEDPIQWARDRRNAERDAEGDFGPEDYFDGMISRGRRAGEDVGDGDEFVETLLLVLLCAAISGLVWYRGRWQERRREEERRQQNDIPGDG